MECLGGMRLQSFLFNGHFVYSRNAPASVYIFARTKDQLVTIRNAQFVDDVLNAGTETDCTNRPSACS